MGGIAMLREFRPSLKRIAVLCLVVGLIGCYAPVSAATQNGKNNQSSSKSTASSPPANISNGVTQSYNADASVEVGMMVQLKAKDSNTVVPVSENNIVDMLGVVIPPSNATIVLVPKTVTQQQVLVATTGRNQVLVSNQDGPINIGDYITISSIAGVGMKASGSQDEVLGKAAAAFSGTSNVIGSIPLKNTIGGGTTVSIGRIPVDMAISRNPLFARAADYIPGFLSKIALTVANKPVSSARIYLSMALLVITALVTGNLLYSGVRSGMQAIGRNPLSKKSIIKSLIETVIAGLIIFIVGVLAVYLLLKL
jgi:hypothetical protein